MGSRQELISMLQHVQYEIRHCMLIPEWRDEAYILKEAVFLSFFIHARVLTHFFQDTSGWPDDVFSCDFGFSPAKLPLPADVNTRFGKDMMHLSWNRLRHTPESKPWPMRDVFSNQANSDGVRRSYSRHVCSRTPPQRAGALAGASRNAARYWNPDDRRKGMT